LHFKSGADASVHSDYYTARFAKVRDGHKVYWDSRKQAVRQVFTISDLFQNTITYVIKCCSEHQILFTRARGSGHGTISRYGTVVTVISVSAQMGGFLLVYSGTINFTGNKLD